MPSSTRNPWLRQGSSISVWVQHIIERGLYDNEGLRECLVQEITAEKGKHQRLLRLHFEIGLPVYPFQELEAKEPINLRTQLRVPSYDGYAIRATPTQSEMLRLKIERAQGLDISGLELFLRNLPAPATCYQIVVNSYFRPRFSGTIICQLHMTLVELTEGEHFLLNQQMRNRGSLIQATLKPSAHGLTYSTDDHRVRAVMWEALQFLRKPGPLNPLDFPDDLRVGYFEFVYHDEYGFRFIEAREPGWWTGLLPSANKSTRKGKCLQVLP